MCMLDVYDRWERYDRRKEAELENLPLCSKCHNPVQQERAVYYNDQWICEDCETEFWREIREDFLESVVE